MSHFPTVGNLISWAGLCPRFDESAGKHRSTRIRKGAPWLKTTVVSAAWAAGKTKGTYLQAQFQRLRARRGAKKAIIAVAASMLTAAYYILRAGVPYKDLGPEHFTRRNKELAPKRLKKRREELDFAVDIRPALAEVLPMHTRAQGPDYMTSGRGEPWAMPDRGSRVGFGIVLAPTGDARHRVRSPR